MAIGIGIGLSPSFGGGGAGPVTIPAPFSRVNGPSDAPGGVGGSNYEGWSVYSASGISNDTAYTVSRQGYNASGGTTTYLDTYYITRQIRQVFPNIGVLQADYFANSDNIYSTDTPSGSVTNNSTFTSPKPVANWVTPARRLVGNTIGGNTVPVEIVAFHRDARGGKQVACVIYRITDGTNTVSVTVSEPEVSVYPGDLNAVIVYKLPATDISSLATGLITVNAEVYPWIGAAASVLNSTASSVGREFSPRYFHKNATKFATPDIIYVSTTGNDATAQVNDPGLPALTITGAINRMRTGSTGAPWSTATTQIRILTAGTYALATSPSGTSSGFGAGLVITRDPGVSKASAVVQFGAGYQPALDGSLPGAVTTAALIITDVATIRTGGALNIARGSTARLEVQCDNVTMDLNATGAALVNNSDLYFYGVVITNNGTGNFGASASGQQRIWRGVSITTPGTSTEAWLHVGCNITANNSSLTTASGQTQEGQILAFNKYTVIANTSFASLTTAITNGAAIVQNVFEYTTASTGNAFAVSHDSQTNNTLGVIFHNNTFAGFLQNGRSNLFYDDGATARTNKLMSVRGNLFTQINTKGDEFRADGTRIGNWAFLWGVGCLDNWSQYIDANNGGLGTSFAQEYGGRGSSIGTSNTTPQMATSRFTNYQAATSGPTVGAGGGTYTVSASAEVKGIVDVAVLSHDLAGTARPTTADTAGAYVAP
jgi:hypothetical protein